MTTEEKGKRTSLEKIAEELEAKSLSDDLKARMAVGIRERRLQQQNAIDGILGEGTYEKVHGEYDDDDEEKRETERKPGESWQDCVKRKIPIIMNEKPGMDQEQAVAIAHRVCGAPKPK